MSIYLMMGGAYGDSRWVQQEPPDDDQMKSWKCGELEVFKVDSEMRIWEPDGDGGWEIIKTFFKTQ